MPVIVDEVVISVEVDNPRSSAASAPSPAQDKQGLVEECVERVLEILRRKAER